jgi:hypothetical protein
VATALLTRRIRICSYSGLSGEPEQLQAGMRLLGLPAGQRVPDTGAGPQGGRDMRQSQAPLPVSYAWYLVRHADWFDSGMALHCSGRTGGVFTDEGDILGKIRDGDGLDTLIRWADERRAGCEWAVSPPDEREHPELTAQKRAEVHLKGTWDWQASRSFAKLHRLDHNVWDAWLHPAHLEGHTVREEPPVRLTPQRRQLRDGAHGSLPGHGRRDAGKTRGRLPV